MWSCGVLFHALFDKDARIKSKALDANFDVYDHELSLSGIQAFQNLVYLLFGGLIVKEDSGIKHPSKLKLSLSLSYREIQVKGHQHVKRFSFLYSNQASH